MELDARTLLTILGMALVTYATRAGGFWLMRWVPLTRRTEALLRHLPGAVLVAVVAPAALASGPAEALAVAATAAMMIIAGREWLAILVGAGVVAVGRSLVA